MNYMGYEVEVNGNSVILNGVENFNTTHMFDCGQCFRWNIQEDGSYTGVIYGRVINVNIKGDSLIIKNTSYEDFKTIWFDYFDLGTNYKTIKEILCKDSILQKAVEYGWGIRLLRQEFFETLISFIISSNNNIPRIKKIIEELCFSYGRKIVYNDTEYYTFPDADALSLPSIEEIAACRGGYRCRYISETSKAIKLEDIDVNYLKSISVEESRKMLMNFCGVGNKVADCVLLFSGIHFDIFPTDVWIKRAIQKFYSDKVMSNEEINAYTVSRFGNLAGYAQQYLFYYIRDNQ